MLPLRGCGAIDDNPDPYDYPASRLVSAGEAPDRYFFEDETSDYVWSALQPRDQGQSSACVGFAITSAVRLVAALRGVGLPELSPMATYALARELDDGDMSDHGVRPRAAFKSIQKYGVVEEGRFPFEYDAVSQPVPLDVIRAGAVAQVSSYYRLDSVGDARVADLRRAISQRYVPVFAMALTEGYDWIKSNRHVSAMGEGSWLSLPGADRLRDREVPSAQFLGHWMGGRGKNMGRRGADGECRSARHLRVHPGAGEIVMTIGQIVVLALAAILASCRATTLPVPPPLVPEPSRGDAAAACERLAELRCPEAKPLLNGRACEDIIHDAASDGLVSPSCIAHAADRQGLAACRVRCIE